MSLSQELLFLDTTADALSPLMQRPHACTMACCSCHIAMPSPTPTATCVLSRSQNSGAFSYAVINTHCEFPFLVHEPSDCSFVPALFYTVFEPQVMDSDVTLAGVGACVSG